MDYIRARDPIAAPVFPPVVLGAGVCAQCLSAAVVSTFPAFSVRTSSARVDSVPLGVVLSAATRPLRDTIASPVTIMASAIIRAPVVVAAPTFIAAVAEVPTVVSSGARLPQGPTEGGAALPRVGQIRYRDSDLSATGRRLRSRGVVVPTSPGGREVAKVAELPLVPPLGVKRTGVPFGIAQDTAVDDMTPCNTVGITKVPLYETCCNPTGQR